LNSLGLHSGIEFLSNLVGSQKLGTTVTAKSPQVSPPTPTHVTTHAINVSEQPQEDVNGSLIVETINTIEHNGDDDLSKDSEYCWYQMDEDGNGDDDVEDIMFDCDVHLDRDFIMPPNGTYNKKDMGRICAKTTYLLRKIRDSMHITADPL
jgi:hypothetical protein